MRIAIGCDPNAVELKKAIIEEITELGDEVTDFGAEDPVYANVVIEVCEAVAAGKFDRGVVLCGTGIGASIAANKVKGISCALLTDAYQAERATRSNNANVIAFGAQVTGAKSARVLVRTYLQGEYVPGGRSEPKVNRIAEYDNAR